MKSFVRIIAILLAVLCGLCSVSLAESPLNHMGFALLEQQYDGEHNCAISPVSLALALSMASEGASGETKTQIDALTGITDAETASSLMVKLQDQGLKIANAVFVADDVTLQETWRSIIEGQYDGKVFPLGEQEALDAWVREKTDHLLDKAPSVPDKNTLLALMNAVAMDLQWEVPFSPIFTRDEVFYAPKGNESVPFMLNEFDGHMVYGERDGAQMLRLNYADSEMFMLLAFPEEGGMEALLQMLIEEELGWFDGMAETDREIILWLPKVDITAHNDLTEPLQNAGVSAAFTDVADFSGIAEEPLMISSVCQDVRIQFDEESTRATAITMLMMGGGEAPMRETPILMRLDRPFVALIVEAETETVCFAAVIADPQATE